MQVYIILYYAANFKSHTHTQVPRQVLEIINGPFVAQLNLVE